MSSISADSYSTLSTRTGLSGSSLMSGLDTESIIKAYTTTTREKITKALQDKQVATWKRDAYRNIETDMNTFYNTNFSYSSDTCILSSDYWNTSSITSSSDYVTATGNSDSVSNMVIKDITQLASAANSTSTHKVTNQNMMSGTIYDSWVNNSIAGKTMTVNYGGSAYTLTVSSSFYLNSNGTDSDNVNAVIDQLNTQISNNSTLKGKLAFSLDGNTVKLTQTGGSSVSDLYIKSGDSNLLTGLGMSTSTTGSTEVTGTADYSSSAFFQGGETKQLGDVLSGTTLTFSLNGISKTISFDESSKTSFDTKEELATYLQSKLSTAFGSNKVFVSLTNDKLSFAAVQKDVDGNVTAGDASSILSVTASNATGILSQNGALHMVAGESNRMEKVKTISQIMSDLSTPLTADSDGKYKISVNGKEFDFTGDTLVGDIISKINKDEDAGVTISYSSVTDTFSIKADDSGSQGKIDIADVGTSNLATVLFGTKGSTTDGYTVTDGTDFTADMSFDGGKTYTQVTRSANTFEIDGVTLTFKNVDATKSATNVQFTANKNTDDLYTKIKTFVDAYNKIVKEINDQYTATLYGEDADSTEKYLPLTDDQKKEMSDDEITAWETKAKTGLLSNDENLGKILTNLRRAMNDVLSGSSDALYQIGIETTGSWTDGGLLEIDESKLKEALNKDSDHVISMFTQTDTGVAYRLKDTIKSAAVGSSSLLYSIAGSSSSTYDTSQYTTKISDLTTKISDLKDLLQTEEDRWWNKFTALEEALSTLNSQSEYLSSFTGSSSS